MPAPDEVARFLLDFSPGLTLDDSNTDSSALLAGPALTVAASWVALKRAALNPPDYFLHETRTVADAIDLVETRHSHLESPQVLGSVEHAQATRERRVVLRPIAPADIPHLYAAAMDPLNSQQWRYGGRTMSPPDFERTLFQGTLSTFVVASANTDHDEPLGLVAAYDARFDNGTASIAFVATHADRAEYTIFEAMFYFIEFLFQSWNLRKLYAEMPSFNAEALMPPQDGLFVTEARLSEHVFHAGRWHDYFTFALTRDRWEHQAQFWRPFIGD